MIPLLSSLAVAVLAFFLYRYRPVRLLLRVFPALLISLLIANFTIGIRFTRKAKPPVVLIDASPSMKRYLADAIREAGNLGFEHRLFFFSESTTAALPDSGRPAGRLTDITNALLWADKLDPSSVILISDGNHNYGEAPSARLGDIQTPVICFGAGADTIRDISIAEAFCPDFAYQGDTLEIETAIESQGFPTGTGDIVLRSSDRNVELKRSFPLSNVSARQTVKFKIAMQDFGEKKFTIGILPRPGEADQENNSASLAVNVLERKITLLYYTDHVSFNTRFILNAIRKNPHIEFTALARLQGDDLWLTEENRKAQDLPGLGHYDIAILDNIKPAKIPWRDLGSFVRMGKGLLVTGSIESMRDDLREILPIETAGSQTTGEFEINVTRPFSVLSPLQSYPPFYSMNRAFAAKSKSTVIATAADLPAIAYLPLGKGVVFQVNCVDLGNWELNQTGSKNEELLAPLLSDIIRLLSPSGRETRLVLKTPKTNYARGEIINARLESYDRDFMLRSGGDFFLQYSGRKVPFFEVRPGIYDATFTADSSGDLEMTATGDLDAEVMTSNAVRVSVAGTFTEPEKPLNKGLLMEISEQTGGMYYRLDELSGLKPPAAARLHAVKRFGIDSPLVYILVFVLLAVDWFLRKKQGTI